ncbi:MAG: hypothetical protein QF684_05495, partial [Candidatus Thalassarchaeaceae archaeon]|nr:hypothetical protein [Candidatus Thalassarchaeaceae archaeon]
MVTGIGRFGWALCVLFLLAPLGMSESAQRHHSNQSHPDDAPQIIIDQHQGLLIETSLNITGEYIDEELPIAMTWKIFNSLELIAEGDLISHLIETDDLHESSRDSWQFSLNLNFTSYAPCSCILEIEGTDTNNRIDIAQLILFSQSDNQEEQLAPSIILKVPSEQLTGDVDLEAIAMDDEGFVGVQWSISNNSEIAMSCIQTWIGTPESIQWNNLTPPILQVNPTWSLDSTAYDDGVYSLIVRAFSEDGLYSPCACQSIGIDNHAPTAQIDGPSDL